MQIITRSLPKNHKLFLVGDIHEGTIFQHDHGLKQVIDMVLNDKNSYIALMGDFAEAISIDDKRYDRATIDPVKHLPLQQYISLAKTFMPVKNKILVALEGNHDYKISNRFGNGVRDILCRELGIPYGTFSCKLIVNDKNGLMYKAHLTHGSDRLSSRAKDPVVRAASMQAALQNALYAKHGDCVLHAQGHSHKLIVRPPSSELYIVDEGDKLKQRYTKTVQTADFIHPNMRWYVSTGSFLKLFHLGESGYAERAGFDPVELGFPIVEVEDGIIQNVRKVILD